jgi:hypothetical protein
MQARASKIAQSQLRTRFIFEIAHLTANFFKFARLGAHFEKNCTTKISGVQHKLSSLACLFFLHLA